MMSDREMRSRPGSAWYFVAVLTLLYVFSFIDRFILALLITPISRDIAITEIELGLLIGASFAVVYSVAGLPIAAWVDRGNRRNIIVLGALIWGSCTITSAFAETFAALAASRVGVAVGEATLTPAAVSLIADLFARERRTAPMAVYSGVGGVMTKGVYLIGAGAIAVAGLFSAELGIAPWRMTLLVVGVPPILLGILLALSVREPLRTAGKTPSSQPDQQGALLRELRSGATWYIPFYLSCGVSATMIYAVTTWMPTHLVRAYGLSLTQSGATFGTIGLVMGLLGSVTWPSLVGFLRRRGRSDAIPIAMLVSSVGVVPFLAIYMLAGADLTMLAIGVGGFVFMTTSLVALAPLTVQTHGPPSMHGRLIALMIMTLSLVGLSIGSFLVPWFASYWEGDKMALGRAITLVVAFTLPAVLLCYAAFWMGLSRALRAGTVLGAVEARDSRGDNRSLDLNPNS